MKKCANPDCRKLLIQRGDEDIYNFKRRSNCDRRCGAKSGAIKQGQNLIFYGSKKYKRKTKERWKTGGPIVAECEGCHGIKDDKCRFIHQPMWIWLFYEDCFFKRWGP